MPQAPKPRRAAIYVRISKDKESREVGVARQERLCREEAERLGWDVIEVFSDNDTSAFNGKPRPAYQRMLRELRAGTADAVVAYSSSRLHRQLREGLSFLDLCDDKRIELRVLRGDYDLSTRAGRRSYRKAAMEDEDESDKIGERLEDHYTDEALRGIPHFGRIRPFGYERAWVDEDGTLLPSFGNVVTAREQGRDPVRTLQIVATEAELIREAVAHVLAGGSLRSRCAIWKERGVTTPEGGAWRPGPLKLMLTSARIAGIREHHVVRLKRREEVGPGNWEPIISRQTLEQVRAVLRDPSRRPFDGPGRPAGYLLSAGLAVCGACNTRLVGRNAGGKPRYACAKVSPYDGCGGVKITAEPLEELVRDAVFSAIDMHALDRVRKARSGKPGAANKLMRDITADEERLAQLSNDYYVANLIPRRDFLAARDRLQERVAQSRGALGRLDAFAGLANLPAADALRTRWASEGLHWRRSVLAAVIDRVEIRKADPTFPRRFDADRVNIVWKV